MDKKPVAFVSKLMMTRALVKGKKSTGGMKGGKAKVGKGLQWPAPRTARVSFGGKRGHYGKGKGRALD